MWAGPAIFMGRAVDLTGQSMGRPMCFPVLKGTWVYADVLFYIYCWFFGAVFPSGFRETAAFGP